MLVPSLRFWWCHTSEREGGGPLVWLSHHWCSLILSPQLQTQLEKEVNAKGPVAVLLTAKEKIILTYLTNYLGIVWRIWTRLSLELLHLFWAYSCWGPLLLMRITRISSLYSFRISVNVCTWKYPYLTFWTFSFLCTLMIVLLIFPVPVSSCQHNRWLLLLLNSVLGFLTRILKMKTTMNSMYPLFSLRVCVQVEITISAVEGWWVDCILSREYY